MGDNILSGEAPSYVPLLTVALLAFAVPLLSARVRFVQVPVVVGEILAGILLGRSGLNIIHSDAILAFLSDFGLAYLMFLSGLELNFSHLIPGKREDPDRGWRLFLRHPLAVPGGAFVLTLAASLAASHYLVRLGLLEDPWLAGFIFATTSLGVVLPVLKERNLAGTGYGQGILAYASIADFITMVLITAWAATRGGEGSRELLYLFLFLVFFLQVYRGGTFFARLPLVRNLLNTATGHFDVRAAMALVLVFIALAQQLGVESILGAFMAGAMISLLSHESEQLRLKLDVIGFGFFVPIFFIMFGAELDLAGAFASDLTWRLLPAILAAAFLVKVIPGLLFWTRYNLRDTLAGGFLLSAQLSLTIAATEIAQRLGVLGEATVSAFLLMAILTSLLAPMAFNRLSRAEVVRREGVVVIGDSRFAVALARRLASAVSTTLLLEPSFSGEVEENGYRVVRGTGDLRSDLRAAGAASVRALLAIGSDPSRNIEFARLARDSYGVENVVVTGEPSFVDEAAAHGIRLVTHELSTMLLLTAATLAPGAVELLAGEEDGTRIEEMELLNPAHKGCRLRTCFLPSGVLVLGVRRGADRIVAHGDTALQLGDRVMVMGLPAELEKVRHILEGV